MESWADFINGLDFELPEGGGEKPMLEDDIPEEEPKEELKKVFVQKVTTEVWIYTDIENKTNGTQTFQDLTVFGEMDFDAFTGIINKRKTQRRRKS